MATIKARVGSQNTVRVLSSSATVATRIIDASDLNSTLKTEDGMILVWDSGSSAFIMTSVIDSASTTIEGIAYFTNNTISSLPTNGALVVNGGVGIGQYLNVGAGVSVVGIATFASDVDINAAVDILNGLNVGGATTLASRGGITTTGGSLFVGGNFEVAGSSNFIGDVSLTGDTRIVGFLSVTEGLFYDSDDYDGPNGVAYFNNNGKLVSAASTESAVSTSNYILTTQLSAGIGTPIWTDTIDGGTF